MYKDYNVTQLTLPMKTSFLSQMIFHANDIVETIPETEFDESSSGCNIIPFKNDFKRTMTFYVKVDGKV